MGPEPMNATMNNSAHTAVPSLGIADRYAIGILYVILGFLGIFGNAGVLLAISSSRVHRRRMSGLFLLNLAISDFLVCLIASPYYLVGVILKPDLPIDHDPFRSEYIPVCKLMMFFTYFTGFLRILSLAAMSVDRYLAINHPYFYTRYCNEDVSRTRSLLAVISLWLIGIVSLIPALVSDKMIVFFGYNGRPCGVMWSESTFTYVVTIMFIDVLLPAMVIIFTNCKVFWLARKQVVRERIKKQGTRRSFSLAIRARKNSKRVEPAPMRETNIGRNCAEAPEIHLSDYNSRLENGSTRISVESANGPWSQNSRSINIRGAGKSENLALPSNRARDGENICDENGKSNFLSPGPHDQPSNSSAMNGTNSLKRRRKETKDEKRRTSSDWEIALSTLALVLFYFISYLPFAVTRFLTTSSKSSLSLQMVGYTTLFTSLDSAINPLIILKTRREFRRILKKRLCSKSAVDNDVTEWMSKNNPSCN